MKQFYFSKKSALAIVALTGLFSLACVLSTVLAWNDPDESAPGGNVEAPINVSSTPQNKTGDLSVGSGSNYWISKNGDSFVLRNESDIENFILGQNGFTGIALGSLSPDPTAILDVNGRIRVRGGTPGAGKVLASDANGLAAWTTLTGTLPAGASGQTLRHDGTAWIGNTVIYNNGTNVGIGTAVPGAKLEVAGQVKITGGTPGAGKVLTSDASGLATWQTPASGSIGGGGTVNYISKFTAASTVGDSQIFDNGTNVGIGKNNPAGKLDINAVDALYIVGENVLSHISGGSTYLKAPSSQTIAFQIPSGTNVASIDASGVSAPAFYYSSDQRLKNNIRPIGESLNKIQELDGVYFNWIKDQSPSIGLVAQDVELTFPEAVSTNPETGLKSVDYGKLVAPLIEAVKAQQEQIESLKQEIEMLKQSNSNNR